MAKVQTGPNTHKWVEVQNPPAVGGCCGPSDLSPIDLTPPRRMTGLERRQRAASNALMSFAQAKPAPTVSLTWACGVTTVPERRSNGLLLRTLASLRAAGFDKPRLFVDGSRGDDWDWRQLDLDITFRWPRVRCVANWFLAALELIARNPTADRFAVFQDDVIFSQNVRQYLDATSYPEHGYLNLFTFRESERTILGTFTGFRPGASLNDSSYPSDWQKGLGALALVFSREALTTLLQSPHVYRKLLDVNGGWQRVDGAVVTAMNMAGWHEYVHAPTLCQHTGLRSTIEDARHHNQPLANTWMGEGFDALSLLKKQEGT